MCGCVDAGSHLNQGVCPRGLSEPPEEHIAIRPFPPAGTHAADSSRSRHHLKSIAGIRTVPIPRPALWKRWYLNCCAKRRALPNKRNPSAGGTVSHQLWPRRRRIMGASSDQCDVLPARTCFVWHAQGALAARSPHTLQCNTQDTADGPLRRAAVAYNLRRHHRIIGSSVGTAVGAHTPPRGTGAQPPASESPLLICPLD